MMFPPTTPVLPRVAYFCMEYALDPSLTVYAGGLGVLAGDYLKSAGDLRLPVIGLGLLWGEGYVEQQIGADGGPIDRNVATARDDLDDVGVELEVTVRGHRVPCRAYRVRRHLRGTLYLLEPALVEDRWITRRLYGGGEEERIAQEIVLGVGGVRLLAALGEEVDVHHFNEGHAVFGALELLRENRYGGTSLGERVARLRRHVVFTTHTPVAAGNELHALDVLRALGADLGFTDAELSAIGGAPFSMTVAGLRLARIANAVSQLHGETARAMWRGVKDAAPIIGITNGVHPGTWQDPRVRVATAPGRTGDESARALWAAHLAMKAELCALVEERTGARLVLDRPLVGFARRMAAYKRPGLVLDDPVRLARLLAAGVQLVFAGKAHPRDTAGKAIAARLVTAAQDHPDRIVFLENYDLALAAALTRGCDVWLNNPRRPLEASGTSGMKAAMNGVLNLSILDGWWPEGCEHGVTGWRIGEPEPGDDAFDDERAGELDLRDRARLHDVLEDEVLPAWEERARWVAMMRASVAMASWRFSSDRMVEEYFARLYRA